MPAPYLGEIGIEAPMATIGAIDWRTLISLSRKSRTSLVAPTAPTRA